MCEEKETVDGESKYYETCQEKELGELVQETILTGGKESIEIGKDTLVIRDEKTDRTRYYYVVIEFLNKENQNEMMSSKLNGRIHVELTTEKTTYKESILNGMDPIIKDELIPVTIENDGTVRKADESDNWYSYENQEWANAIILKDESETYCPGEIIEEESIESYFVWIPTKAQERDQHDPLFCLKQKKGIQGTGAVELQTVGWFLGMGCPWGVVVMLL